MCQKGKEHDPVNVEETDIYELDAKGIKEMKQQLSPEILHAKPEWVPRNIAIFVVLHVMAAVGVYHMLYNAKWQTMAFVIVAWIASVLGITAGAHRLWSHRSFRASRPFRIVLMILQTMAVQNSIVEWVRDHRCHHKWTDTDADPHNASRGLFFSHIGWLLQRKHPAVKEMGGKVNMADVRNDPVVAFQEKYYLPLVLIFGFLVPTAIPVVLWAESAAVSFFVAGIFRYVFSLHDTWTINSFAHHFGYKPYDGRIMATENSFLAVFTVGEGGHNYHHTFPYDYRTSEYEYAFNLGKVLIDLGAYFGQVTERRVVSQEMINRRVAANTAIYGKCEEYEQFLQSKAEKARL